MKHLTKEQRYVIQSLHKRGISNTEISKELAVHKATVGRELKRNSSKRGRYNADKANIYANEQKERFAANRAFTQQIEKFVKEKIEQEQWSPEQIVGYCKQEGILMVSHERIYAYLREDKTKGGLLYKQLRHQLKHRKCPISGKQNAIKDRVSIELRSDIINNKELGDWEIDLIIGKDRKGVIVTIVERTTGFFLMRKLPLGKNAEGVAKVVIDMLLSYKDFIHSMTSE